MRRISHLHHLVIAMFSCSTIAVFQNSNLSPNHSQEDNVEALATGENCGETTRYSCVKHISSNETYGKSYTQRFCGDCKEHTITKEWDTSECQN